MKLSKRFRKSFLEDDTKLLEWCDASYKNIIKDLFETTSLLQSLTIIRKLRLFKKKLYTLENKYPLFEQENLYTLLFKIEGILKNRCDLFMLILHISKNQSIINSYDNGFTNDFTAKNHNKFFSILKTCTKENEKIIERNQKLLENKELVDIHQKLISLMTSNKNIMRSLYVIKCYLSD